MAHPVHVHGVEAGSADAAVEIWEDKALTPENRGLLVVLAVLVLLVLFVPLLGGGMMGAGMTTSMQEMMAVMQNVRGGMPGRAPAPAQVPRR